VNDITRMMMMMTTKTLRLGPIALLFFAVTNYDVHAFACLPEDAFDLVEKFLPSVEGLSSIEVYDTSRRWLCAAPTVLRGSPTVLVGILQLTVT